MTRAIRWLLSKLGRKECWNCLRMRKPRLRLASLPPAFICAECAPTWRL